MGEGPGGLEVHTALAHRTPPQRSEKKVQEVERRGSASTTCAGQAERTSLQKQ